MYKFLSSPTIIKSKRLSVDFSARKVKFRFYIYIAKTIFHLSTYELQLLR